LSASIAGPRDLRASLSSARCMVPTIENLALRPEVCHSRAMQVRIGAEPLEFEKRPLKSAETNRGL